MNKARAKKLIDDSYETYLSCWDILCSIKNIKNEVDSEAIVNGIIRFQNILAERLFLIENEYTGIARKKELMIKNKSKYSYQWFCARMNALSNYQKYIVITMNIGRTLGDAFAWFFYQNELSYLGEHLNHKKITHMPTGIGGIGELQFLKNINVFKNHITLYHGITNILRLGDFSAYSGANWTVIPAESGHRFRVKLDTNSGGNWTPIPA